MTDLRWFLTVLLPLLLLPTFAQQKADTTYTFRFVPQKDMFYVPWNGNGEELERLLTCVKQNRHGILNKKLPVLVDGYCNSHTDRAKKLADLSSLSVGDVLSVLKLLGGVISDYMNNGRSVKLDGVGTFYYTANSEGQGVDSPDEVGAQQITGTRVRFIPETTRDSSNKVTTRSLVGSDVFWELLDEEIPARPVPDGEDSGDGDEELPLG